MKIAIWGDSITYGTGDSEALGWVGRLRKRLTDEVCRVHNRGIGGDTSTGVLRRLEVEVDSLEPEISMIAIGTNDSKFPDKGKENKVSFNLFETNLKEIIQIMKSKSQTVIVVGLTQMSESPTEYTDIFTNESLKRYDNAIKEIAQDMDVEYIDMWEILDTESDIADGLHPNDGGYEKMFRSILPVVQKYIY